jgi:protocatechuate 3,4-dioxygenase beta subunit
MTTPEGHKGPGGRIGRRGALAALGTVGLGSLLAACSGDGGSGGGASATTVAEVATTEGTTATVQPQTATGAAAKALLDGATTCTLSTELTEGPYYFDVDSIRSDVREDRPGTLLRLALRVQQAQSCTPIGNAVVDIWHCDAGGVYSGFESASRGGPGGGRTDDETYLRGAQVTNADGIVEFATIYPGWYRGRTTHIHLKVHLNKTTLLTSQLFFDEAVNSAVYAKAPYSARSGRDTFNDGDGIFDQSLIVTTKQDGDAWLAALNLSVR